MNTQQTIDFLYSQLSERFNDVNTFKPITVKKDKVTNQLNAFSKVTKLGTIVVGVFTYDENTEDGEYIRAVNFNGKTYQF